MAANARVDRDVADVVGDVGHARWWGLGFGVLSVIAGVIALAWPDATVVVVATVFGVQLFVLGIFRVVAAFVIPTRLPRPRCFPWFSVCSPSSSGSCACGRRCRRWLC
jgi:hypothetical protein